MRGVVRLLAALVGPALADAIAGDLAEGLQARRVRSRLGATLWFLWSILAIAVWVAADRLRGAARSHRAGGHSMSRWVSDFRHAGRGLRRRPGLSASIVVVLALGIGLSTAVFALADPYLLRSLPYAAPSALVAIEVSGEGLTRNAVLPTIDDWRARDDLFSGIAVANAGRAVERLRLPDRSVVLISQAVSPNLFQVLGVPEPAGASWRAATGAERAMVFLPAATRQVPRDVLEGGGSLRTLDGGVVHVAGTVPDTFVQPFSSPQDVLALTPAPVERIIAVRSWNDDGTPERISTSPLVARLAPGVTPAAVREALAMPLPSGRRLAVTVTPLHRRLAAPVQPLALGAVAAGLLVVFVCAGNVANLLLASAAWRVTEMATRRALGASRLDLWRLSCAEGAVLMVSGTVLAFAVAATILVAAGRVIPFEYSSLGAPAVTLRAVVFGLLVASTLGVLAMAPALFRNVAVAPGGAPAAAAGRRGWSLRASFVALQTCLATILVTGATLLVHSYMNLETQRTGFDRDVIAITAIYPTGPGAPPVEIYEESAGRLARLPGVTGVATFFGNAVIGDLAEVVGRLTPQSGAELELDGRRVEVTTRTVSTGFFDVAGLDLVEGRPLQSADAGRGVVINQALASLMGPEDQRLGRSLRLGDQVVTIVGVVEDAFETRFTQRPSPTIYAPFGGGRAGAVTYLMRADAAPATYATSARRAIFEAEPDAIVVEMNTLGTKLANTVRDRSFATVVLLLFGAAGFSVTITGLVGVVAFTVARRTREIAIRTALGARGSHVRWIVVSEVLTAALVGVAAGLALGRWLSTGLESLVYGVEAGNWLTAIAAAAMMLVVSSIAALGPAQRAVRRQPTEALRVG